MESTDVLDLFSYSEKTNIEKVFPCNLPLLQLPAFIYMAPKMMDDLSRALKNWTSDVIIHDPLEFGGYIVAEQRRIPYASIFWTSYTSIQLLCPEPLVELRKNYNTIMGSCRITHK
jgi:hypothetical protein